jgi:hypothetical protein
LNPFRVSENADDVIARPIKTADGRFDHTLSTHEPDLLAARVERHIRHVQKKVSEKSLGDGCQAALAPPRRRAVAASTAQRRQNFTL